MVYNFYNTNKSKNALVIYIEEPFKRGALYAHTNQVEALEMASVLKREDYNVDVMDYRTKKAFFGKVPFEKYDFVMGIDMLWLALARRLCRPSCKIVFYATGAWPQFARAAQLKRYSNFTKRTGINIDSDVKLRFQELLTCNKVLSEVDGIICTGNEWTLNTYRHLNDYVYPSPPTGFRFKRYTDGGMTLEKKHSFIWFGSRGLVHKGLDLCIEVFSERNNEVLYIAGPREEKVFTAYEKELKQENIRYIGFLDVRTKRYEEVCKKCAFVIFPSCSEGTTTSVITVMAMGLIPIVTRQCGVEIGDFGFMLEDDRLETINACVEYVTTLSDEEIQTRQRKAYEYAMKNHSLENYAEKLAYAIKEITAK